MNRSHSAVNGDTGEQMTIIDHPNGTPRERADATVIDPPPAPLPAPMVEPITETDQDYDDGSSVIPGLAIVRLPSAVGIPPLLGNPVRDRAAATLQEPIPEPRLVEAYPPPAPTTQLFRVVRGERLHVGYPLLEGKNLIGRSADKPVDIDLVGQEPEDQIWTSRQHALVTLHHGQIVIEDLNSLNGTFVNRLRIHPGQQRLLKPGDVVQVGTVQLRVEG
ncbi:MAG: FHA domain-containing protein [Bacteroidales bacterium]|nr:FHA domain-containing protein [Bacteroidales bacterium]